MSVAIVGDLQIDRLREFAKVSQGKALVLFETCVWCMTKNDHSNGSHLKVVEFQDNDYYRVIWDDSLIDIAAIYRSYNHEDAAERGAEAVALSLGVNRTDTDAVERSVRGEGIDYWLGFVDSNPNYPFHKKYRLESSGIFKEDASNTINKRVRVKLEQTAPTDHLLPVCVIVVEFSKMVAKMVWKNVNGQ